MLYKLVNLYEVVQNNNVVKRAPGGQWIISTPEHDYIYNSAPDLISAIIEEIITVWSIDLTRG